MVCGCSEFVEILQVNPFMVNQIALIGGFDYSNLNALFRNGFNQWLLCEPGVHQDVGSLNSGNQDALNHIRDNGGTVSRASFRLLYPQVLLSILSSIPLILDFVELSKDKSSGMKVAP